VGVDKRKKNNGIWVFAFSVFLSFQFSSIQTELLFPVFFSIASKEPQDVFLHLCLSAFVCSVVFFFQERRRDLRFSPTQKLQLALPVVIPAQ